MVLGLGEGAGTPFCSVFPLREGADGGDLNSWILLPSAALPPDGQALGGRGCGNKSCLLASVCVR